MYLEKTGDKENDEYLQRQTVFFKAYCKAKELDPQQVLGELKYFIQPTIKAKAFGTVMEHPNLPGRYLLYATDEKCIGGAFIVENEKILRFEIPSGIVPKKQFEEFTPLSKEEISSVLELYQKTTSLPKFQDGYVYMMEFSAEPNYVLQVRRFKKKEVVENFSCDWKDEPEVIHSELCLGLTPKEGISLPFCNVGLYQPFLHIKKKGLGNREFLAFNRSHPEGFAYAQGNLLPYVKTFAHNAYAGLGGGFAHIFNHGGLANMAEVPLMLFDVKHPVWDLTEGKKKPQLRIFSNGRDGHIKLE